jgi:hypothetical protein
MGGIDFIQGQKFKAIADFIYSPDTKLPGDYDNLANTFDINKLKDVNIVYTHIMYAKQLFDVLGGLTQKFVVITHNSDCAIIPEGVRVMHGGNGIMSGIDHFTIPPNVIKWYSKNVDVVNPLIESIPIGIENDMWFKDIKKNSILTKLQQPRYYHNLVYMNFNILTNTAQRVPPYELLKDKPWVTTFMGQNGHKIDDFIDSIYNHKFVICPEGNGMDTHRTWETLYLGSIPIEKRNINNQFYADLPILFVDDWGEVTCEFLESAFPMFEKQTWNRKKLTFEYWKNKILSTKDDSL